MEATKFSQKVVARRGLGLREVDWKSQGWLGEGAFCREMGTHKDLTLRAPSGRAGIGDSGRGQLSELEAEIKEASERPQQLGASRQAHELGSLQSPLPRQPGRFHSE